MGIRAQLAATAAALCVILVVLLSVRVVATSRGQTPLHSGDPAKSQATTRGIRISASRGIYWGAAIQTPQGQAPWDMNIADQFGQLTGKNISVISWGSLFYSSQYCAGWCNFQTTEFDAVRGYGAIPLFSWGPTWKPQIDAKIAAGADDRYLTSWAEAAKAWGHPLFLRFAWEMNGSWFPWGVGRTGVSPEGNTPATFVAMWRHVYDLFRRVGADNVTWVWCPNVDARETYEPLSKLYPGNAYVNWTCLDGYNGDSPWRSFSDLYAGTYASVTSFAPSKPMLVGEVASTEQGGSKATWIANMFTTLPSLFPDIRGLLWFESADPGPGGRTDWDVNSSKSALQAVKSGISSPIYRSNSYASVSRSPIPPP